MSIDWANLVGRDNLVEFTAHELPHGYGPYPERQMRAVLEGLSAHLRAKDSLATQLERLQSLREIGIPRRLKGKKFAERTQVIRILPDVHAPGENAYNHAYNNAFWDGDAWLIGDHNVHEIFPD